MSGVHSSTPVASHSADGESVASVGATKATPFAAINIQPTRYDVDNMQPNSPSAPSSAAVCASAPPATGVAGTASLFGGGPSASPSLFTAPSIADHSSAQRTPDSPPLCNFVDAMLTESSGLLMCYAHWKTGHHSDPSVFDLFFRQHPFGGEFTIFAGLEEVLRFLQSWTITDDDTAMLARKFGDWDKAFFTWLRGVDMSAVKVYAVREGSVVMPRLPLIRVDGPLGVCQLLESSLLVLVNYASLVTTNAARHRLAVGPNKSLLEFGLRRAQGPDGAMSASRYSYMGGFDGTSNVKAASVFAMDMKGTHAHSFVVSFYSLADVKNKYLVDTSGVKRDFVSAVLQYRSELRKLHTHEGELAAFIAYAQAFPKVCLGLLDTFDTLESGIWNYIGDLAYLSRECRKVFVRVGEQYKIDYFAKLSIVASNDLSEKVLYALKEQGHEIDSFGVGTNLVTCKTQPALGCVFKLVEVNKQPRMKVSSEKEKVTIPGEKEAYRLSNEAGEPLLDLLLQVGTSAPQPNKRILCRHPFDANKRVYVTPHSVQPLHHLVWDGPQHCRKVNVLEGYPSLTQVRQHVADELKRFREDHLRRLNPTPYKMSVSSDLFSFMQDLWLQETPIAEIM